MFTFSFLFSIISIYIFTNLGINTTFLLILEKGYTLNNYSNAKNSQY